MTDDNARIVVAMANDGGQRRTNFCFFCFFLFDSFMIASSCVFARKRKRKGQKLKEGGEEV